MARRRWGRRTNWMGMVCAFWLLAGARPAAAQVFELSGGSSSLFNAHGGSVEFRAQNYVGRFDLGLFGKPQVGFFLATPYRGYNWGLGDQPIPFVLPTDVFNRSYYFLGRGVSVARKDARGKLFVYAGATSMGFALPFLKVAQPETPTGLVFYERQLSPTLRFFSHNVLSKRQTSIQALEWAAQRDMKLGMSAGIGNNQHYWASSFDFNRKVVSLQASYTRAGDAFRRILVETPAVAETDRENVRLELTPRSNLRFSLGRQNYLAPAASGTGELRAAVNSFGVSGSAGGFQMYGSLFGSETRVGRGEALSLGARRHVTSRMEAGVDYLRSAPSNGVVINTLVSTFRESVSRRLTLSQVVTHGSGQTSVAFGGSFLSNWLTASAEYQTIYLPFAPAAQSQFRQVLVVNLHLQLPHAIQLNGATNVTPLGQVRYTAYASTFAYHGLNHENGNSSRGEALYENLVRGRVLDEAGVPVAGAALRIDGELLFSNSGGAFFLRRKKAKEYRLEVLPDQFTIPGKFEVVSAPEMVRAEREQMAKVYDVVVRRRPTSAPSRPSPSPKSTSTSREQRCDLEQVLMPPVSLSTLSSATCQLDALSRSMPESCLKVQAGVEGAGAGPSFSRGNSGADGATAGDRGTKVDCSSGGPTTRKVVRRRLPPAGTARVPVCVRPSNQAAIRRRRSKTPRKQVPLSPCQDTTSSPASVPPETRP